MFSNKVIAINNANFVSLVSISAEVVVGGRGGDLVAAVKKPFSLL